MPRNPYHKETERIIAMLPYLTVNALHDVAALMEKDMAEGRVRLPNLTDSVEAQNAVAYAPDNRVTDYIRLFTHVVMLSDYNQNVDADSLGNFVQSLVEMVLDKKNPLPEALALLIEDGGGDDSPSTEITPEIRDNINTLYALAEPRRDRIYRDAAEYLRDQLPMVELNPDALSSVQATFILCEEHALALKQAETIIKKPKKLARVREQMLEARKEIHATLATILWNSSVDLRTREKTTVDNAVLLALALMGEVARFGSLVVIERLMNLHDAQGTG